MDKGNTYSRYLIQNAALGGAALVMYYFFFWTKAGLPRVHQINRSWADASIVFLAVTLLIGPLVRLWPDLKTLTLWRRDMGMWFGITALIHICVLLQMNLHWNVLRFFMDEDHHLLKAAAHASNWIGLVAIVITLVLMGTSNGWSERFLGPGGWKWIQQSSYSVFYLSYLHAYIFVILIDPRQSTAFLWISISGLIMTMLMQFAAFYKSVRRYQSRKSS
ncbi:MAG: hypothetical protein GC154_12180 [bacterium]|nr:hypothetical protein [bacterium]